MSGVWSSSARYEDKEFLAQVVRETSKGIKASLKGEKLSQLVREMVSADLKGRLPTARQLAGVVRAAMPAKVE